MGVKSAIKNLPTKIPLSESFISDFCQTFKEKLLFVILKLFQKIAQEGILLKT
jgi:hypothetical protein